MTTVHIFDDLSELYEDLARTLLRALSGARDAGRDLTVAVSGGTAPVPLYERLGALGPGGAPWHHMQLLLVDERDVALEEPDSNLGMVRRLWLGPVELSADRVHGPPVPAGDLEAAAREYEETLHRLAGSPAALDWVLLGLGPDGHTASLFPGHSAVQVTDRDVLAVTDSPKPPPRRLTLSSAALQRAVEVHVLVTGASKAEAVRAALEAETDPSKHPTHVLRQGVGTVTWWLDRAADGRARR